jgi:hypothetical protein
MTQGAMIEMPTRISPFLMIWSKTSCDAATEVLAMPSRNSSEMNKREMNFMVVSGDA